MAAMYELLHGFQAANDQWYGRLLKDVPDKDPQHVYHGLLTLLMRTVFILYAEDQYLIAKAVLKLSSPIRYSRKYRGLKAS